MDPVARMAAVYGNGYVTTVTVEARWTQMAQAADASQAAYFGEHLPMNVKRLPPISLAPEIDWTR
jgi:hypothetical protein